MSKEEETLTQIKFVLDMYSARADTADDALEKVLELVDRYMKEAEE